MKNGYLIIVAARGAVFEKNVKSTAVAERMRQSFEKLGLLSGMPDIRPNAGKTVKKTVWPGKIMKTLFIFLIQLYRKYLSPLKGTPTCRFTPTCSEYALEAYRGARAFLSARHSAFGVCFGAIRSERAAMIRAAEKKAQAHKSP